MPDPAKPAASTTIMTAGGAAVTGIVNTQGGNFIGRDQINNFLLRPERALYINVPPLPTYLYGREAVIDGLVTQLIAGTSTALCAEGLPGVGKTTLAVALAHHKTILAHFTDGVLWAGLGPQANVAAIQAQWATALDVDLTDVADPHARRQRLDNAIGQRKLLLVIDDAWELDAATLLRSAGPQVAHLLTTRDRSLARAFAGATHAVSVSVLDETSGYALLQALAPEACAADPLAAQNLVKVVGGLPLALELLSGYLAAPERSTFADLSQQAFAELADPQQRLQLATERLGQPGQVTTLLATIALSLEDLARSKPAAVATFYALGAFAPKPATFTRAAAEAVTGCDGATLAVLIARNLVEQVATPDPATIHLALHQTVADVAQQQTMAALFAKHRDYYLAIVEEDREDWQRIEAIYDQVRQAWFKLPDENVLGYKLALRIYQERRGLWQEYIEWSQRALRVALTQEHIESAASMYVHLGFVYSALGDKQQALTYYDQALPLRRLVGDRRGEANTLTNIGLVYSTLGDKQQALAYYDQALPLHRQVGDRGGEATILNNIGLVYDALGDKQQALAYYDQALPLYRQVGDRWGESVTRYNLAMVYQVLGRLAEAVAELQIVVAIEEAVGHPDLASDRQALARMEALLAAQGEKELSQLRGWLRRWLGR